MTREKINIVTKKFLKGVNIFSAVFGACAIIWMVSVYFTKKDNSDTIVKNKVEVVIVNQNEMMLKLNGLLVLQTNVDKLTRSQENLTNAVTNFIRNNKLATKQDLDNFIEELKKNNKQESTQ